MIRGGPAELAASTSPFVWPALEMTAVETDGGVEKPLKRSPYSSAAAATAAASVIEDEDEPE